MQRVLPPVHVPISCLLYAGENGWSGGPVSRAPVSSHPGCVPCYGTNIELVAVPKDYYCTMVMSALSAACVVKYGVLAHSLLDAAFFAPLT